MNGHGALTWREVVDRHCAALVDELAARLDSEIEEARAEAIAEGAAKVEEAAAKAAVAAEAASARAAHALEEQRRHAAENLERQRFEAGEALERERLQAASAAETAREQAIRETRLSTAEALNQALRRIRQAPSQAEALTVLLDSAGSYSQRAVVLRVENNRISALGSFGIDEKEFSFELESAAAIVNACDTREPVVAVASENELSAELAGALSDGDATRKAYLFPVSARHTVMAVLAAGGECSPAALELLGEAAGLKLEALETEAVPVLKPLPGSELVQIAAPAVPETREAERLAWSDLSAEDQKLHLHAQRMARVKVAEMRLYQAEELRKGVFDGDIYGALKTEIERARADFLQSFLSKSRTMVDYLHLEILRSLAHEDDRLLGPEYPGPMV